MVYQFTSLERRTSPIGKDRIDHGPGGHDDCCNAAAGALVSCVSRAGATDWAAFGSSENVVRFINNIGRT